MNWTQRRKRSARRRLLVRFLAGVAVAAAGLFAAGSFLGSEVQLTREARLGRPPETVWRVLLDLDGLPLWRSDLSAVERLPDLAGHPAWRERGRWGARVVELAGADPPHRLVLRGADEGVPGLPVLTFELAAADPGTRLVVTQRIGVSNPIRRALYRVHPPQGDLARLLRDLEQRLAGGRREVVAVPEE